MFAVHAFKWNLLLIFFVKTTPDGNLLDQGIIDYWPLPVIPWLDFETVWKKNSDIEKNVQVFR